MINRRKRHQSTETWFWLNIKKTENCWLWTRNTSDGYGRLEIGSIDGRKLHTTTHRFSWELHNGPIPEGMQVLHKCDVRACCNPEHLFLGTNGDNVKDRNQKRRHAHGTGHASAKLDEEKVRKARDMYATGGWNYARLGAHFGVADTVMHKAVTRRTWKHVT